LTTKKKTTRRTPKSTQTKSPDTTGVPALDDQVKDSVSGVNKQDFYIREMARCSVDFWYWATNYGFVLDTEEGKGIIAFESWSHLRQLYELSKKHKMLIILKSRQIGVTWLWAFIALWEVLFHTGRTVALFSKKGSDSALMKSNIKFIWTQLPVWMQLPYGKDNDEILEFPANHSKIQCFPATEDAGRGLSGATLIIIDEWAFHEYARKNWGAIYPIAERGRLIGITTADGRNNLFYELWVKAKRRENKLFPVFISWKARPGRTAKWWEEAKANLGMLLGLQEYPLYESDAFLISGDCFFDVAKLHDMPVEEYSEKIGHAQLYIPYNESEHYTAGIDTALGISRGKNDFSVLQIINRVTGEQVALLRSRKPLEKWSQDALTLLQHYGSPPVVIEQQPQGMLVAKVLKDAKYPRIWHKAKDNPTWHTSKPSRDMVLNDLAMDIRIHDLEEGQGITLHDQETINECLGFAYNEDKHKFEASTGHDDTVMALALANHLRKERAFSSQYDDSGTPYVTGLWKTSKKAKTPWSDVDWSVR